MSNNGKLTKVVNCSLVRNHQIVTDYLWLKNGKIANPEPYFFDHKQVAENVIDANGSLIAPGFIDLQINGGFGYDFSSIDHDVNESLDHVSKGIVAHGVTAFCPTIITQSPLFYRSTLPSIQRKSRPNHSTVLGLHLEGPFISYGKKGAHPIDLIHGNDLISFDHVSQVYGDSTENISIITMAPELDVNDKIIKLIKSKNIVVSLGHSEAGLQIGERAVNSGANFITHLFNAMLPFHHRDPGLIGLLTSQNVPHQVFFGIIADGIHTHETAVKIAFRSAPSSLVLVTDAISALGLSVGHVHKIGEQLIDVRTDGAYLSGTDTLCGSIASMDQCVRNLIKFTNCSIVEAIECASLHPAQVMSISNSKGTLNYGSDADFVFLDHNLQVVETFISGKSVWKHSLNVQ